MLYVPLAKFPQQNSQRSKAYFINFLNPQKTMFPFVSLESSKQAARYDYVGAIFSRYQKAYLQMLDILTASVGQPLTPAFLEQLGTDIHRPFWQVKQLHHRDDNDVCQVPKFTLARVGSDLRVLPGNAIAYCLVLITNHNIEKAQITGEELADPVVKGN